MLHNIAVAEYFRDGCTDPQKLLDILLKVKRRTEEISQNAGEQLDVIGASVNTSSTGFSGLKGSNLTPAGTIGLNTDASASMEDYDASIPIFNTAVVLYHLQQFAAALSILEPLYQNIEPIDEPAALRICLLMLDITLASRQLRKAADVFHYMEKVFGLGFLVTPPETGSSVPQSLLVSNMPDCASSTGNTSTTVSSPISTALPEVSLTRSSSDDVLYEEDLSLGLDMEGSNSVKSTAPLSILSSAARVPVERTASVSPRDSNVKILLHLYKVHLLLCTRNIKAAKREVKLAMNLARGQDYLRALILKAQLEYSRANHRKAVKLLTTCCSREPGMRCIFLNNLGCIHHQLRKDHTASVYFLRALHSCASTAMEKPLKLSTFSQDKSLSILYNCGLQQLRSGNPILAARCFQEAGCLYYNQPLLWLRLAECCISALEKGLLEAGGCDMSLKKDELRVRSVGEGKWRKVVLPAGSPNPTVAISDLGLKLEDGNGDESTAGSSPLINETDFFAPGKPHKLSLVFARQCLQNASHLLNRLDFRAVESAAEGDTTEFEDGSQDSSDYSIQKGGVAGNGKGGTNGPVLVGLQTSSNGNTKESKGSNGTNTISASVSAFEEDRQKENSSILQYVLADLAFVELCLENPLKALKAAEKLLWQPECTKAFKFLGHMYAAEALCLLNRPREAADHLSDCLNESTILETPANGGEEDGQKWKSGENSEASADGDDGVSNVAVNTLLGGTLPEALSTSSLTGTRARVSLFVNLALVHVMQGDISQAHQLALQAVTMTPANPQAVLSVVYVELVQGRTEEAITWLKRCRHLCVVSSNLG